MRHALTLFTIALLSGCAAILHGQQTTGGGSTTTMVGSSLHGATRIGNARLGASFGTLPAPGAAGGQVTFSKGATAVLVLGALLAGAANVVGDWFSPPAPRGERLADGPISQTCSCYGWRPDVATPE